MSQCFGFIENLSEITPLDLNQRFEWCKHRIKNLGDESTLWYKFPIFPGDVIKAPPLARTTNISAAVKMQFRNRFPKKRRKKRRSRRRDTKRAQDCSMLHEKWQTINKFLFPFAEPICSQTFKQAVDGCEKTWTAHQVGRRFLFFNENFYSIEFRGFCHFALHSSLSAPFQDFNLIEKKMNRRALECFMSR